MMSKDEKKDPRPAAEDVPLDRVHEWSKNPHPPASAFVRDIMRSIRRFGFASPIVARAANGEIISGHARYRAARRLKLPTIPVRFLEISEPEAHMLALADNKLPELRERDWTDKSIAAILEELEAQGADLEIGTGFNQEEIDDLIGGEDLDDADASEDGGAGGGGGGGDGAIFEVIVTCKDENEQTELLDRLGAEGLNVRALLA